MLCRQEGHALSALSRAEREAREAVEAAGLAKQRSADFAARRVTGDGRRAGPRGRAAMLRSGYVQLAEESSLTGDDAASPARGVVLRSLKAEDAGVDGCGGIAPPPPEDPPGCPRSDAASAHPASAELSGFSLSRSAGAGSGSKSGVHWIPMMDLRASRRTGRVNARLLLVSPQLHAKAVGRMPLVVVLWAVLIVRASPPPPPLPPSSDITRLRLFRRSSCTLAWRPNFSNAPPLPPLRYHPCSGVPDAPLLRWRGARSPQVG